jgi:hypothetical protein
VFGNGGSARFSHGMALSSIRQFPKSTTIVGDGRCLKGRGSPPFHIIVSVVAAASAIIAPTGQVYARRSCVARRSF